MQPHPLSYGFKWRSALSESKSTWRKKRVKLPKKMVSETVLLYKELLNIRKNK